MVSDNIIELRNKIRRSIIMLSSYVSSLNETGKTDTSRSMQNLCCNVGNAIWSYALFDADRFYSKPNVKGIDLIDDKNKIAIQVSARNDQTKIINTIKLFGESYKTKYNTLKYWIIGEKRKTPYDFREESYCSHSDVIDNKNIFDEIEKIDDIVVLGNILALYNNYFGQQENVYSLQGFAETLKIMKNALGSIYQNIGPKKIDKSRIKNENYMEEKCNLNKRNQTLGYEENINHNYTINELITKDPESRSIYNSLCEYIQQKYIINDNNYISIEKTFKKLHTTFNEILIKSPNYHDEYSKYHGYIPILLDNMFFNCDIGLSPNDISG